VGPTFLLDGPTELFPKIVVLFVKCDIGFWILIWAMSGTVLLDFKNMLLSKHGIVSMMPFSLFFLGFQNNIVVKT
jgi:hypothetical protein